MTSYTQNLKLLKKNPSTDGNDTFNVETMLNENWDKVDEEFGKKAGVDLSNVLASDLIAALSNTTAAKIEHGTYIGTGTYGSSNKNSLTFDFEPRVIFVVAGISKLCLYKGSTTSYMYSTSLNANGTYPVTVSNWTNTVSWYSSDKAIRQMNLSDTVYEYTAIGQEENYDY